MRIGATEYADQVLAIAEDRMKKMLDAIRGESVQIDDFFNHSLDVIYQNRQELKNINNER
jgi:hypothetical protein